MLSCVVCGAKGIAVEAGSSLCMQHLHEWMLSKEGKTAQRLYGPHSMDMPEKRVIQSAALMKLFIARQTWHVAKLTDVIIMS